jgi:hypothetical protein
MMSYLAEKLSELRSSLRESHSFLSLHADTTMASSQEDTQNWQTWWEICAVPENIQFSFMCSFLHS